MTNFLLAGGGTAGHVNPLLAVADGLVERCTHDTVIALGTAEGLESRLVPARGHHLEVIQRLPFPRRPGPRLFRFPWQFRAAVERVRAVIREHQIDVVVGFGGYAAAPAYRAARHERVPLVVHEANVRPGLANRWGARTAAAIGTAFPGTRLPSARCVGMPLSSEFAARDPSRLRQEAAEIFGLDATRPVLLVFGGSTGARSINTAIADAAPAVAACGWQILLITGEARFTEVLGAPSHVTGEATSLSPQLRVVPYVSRMELAYALADFVLCRSGAATVSEVSAAGLPAAYVPYPVGNGEQALNAAAAVAAGGAILIPDAKLSAISIVHEVLPLLRNGHERARMRRAASTLGARDGTQRFIELIDSVLN